MRTGVQFPPPNYQSPTGLSWAFLLPVAAGSWGFVRFFADSAERHFGSVLAQFHSLLGYFISNSATPKKPESAKTQNSCLSFQSVTCELFKRFYFGIGWMWKQTSLIGGTISANSNHSVYADLWLQIQFTQSMSWFTSYSKAESTTVPKSLKNH